MCVKLEDTLIYCSGCCIFTLVCLKMRVGVSVLVRLFAVSVSQSAAVGVVHSFLLCSGGSVCV